MGADIIIASARRRGGTDLRDGPPAAIGRRVRRPADHAVQPRGLPITAQGLSPRRALGFDSASAAGAEATYRVQIDGRSFDFAVTEQRLAVARQEPDVILSASASDLVTARLGSIASQRRTALRRLNFQGDRDDPETMRAVLRLSAATASDLFGSSSSRSADGFDAAVA